MISTYHTLTYVTASVAPAASTSRSDVFLHNVASIVKIKVTPSVLGATELTTVELFKRNTFAASELCYATIPFAGILVDPVQYDGVTATERNEGFIALYEDLDATQKMHVKITNTGTVARTFTVAITYSIPHIVFADDFGARGDGVTDSLAAVTAATTYLSTFGGGILEFGFGVYRLSNTWTIDTSGSGIHPIQLLIRGKGRDNTLLIHTGTQTTGCFVASTTVTWNGTFYGGTLPGHVTLQDMGFGSNYGPAVHYKMVGFTWKSIRAISASVTSANFIIDGGGGDGYDVYLDNSGGNYSNEIVTLYNAALPTGGVTFPLNMIRVSTGSYNDGTHGANSGALNRVSFYGMQGYGSVTGNAVLIGPASAAYAEKPTRVFFENCQFAGAVADADQQPAVVKVDGAKQVFFTDCQFEPVPTGGLAGINLELDTYLGNTEVYLKGCTGWGNHTGNVDMGKIIDLGARPADYRSSLHVMGSTFQDIRLNTTVMAAGKFSDLVIDDVLLSADGGTFTNAPTQVTNYSVFNCFVADDLAPTGRTLITNGNRRNYLYNSITNDGHLTNTGGNVLAAGFRPTAAATIAWTGRSIVSSGADGNLLLTNAAGTAFGRLQLGGTTSSFGSIGAGGGGQVEIISADGSVLKNLVAASVRGSPVTFANRPTAVEGMLVAITDSTTATWGATITGGGALHVLAYYNGTNWTVAGA